MPTVHFLPFESIDLYLPFKSKQSFIIITACAATRPQSLPGAETLATAAGPASLTSLTPDHQLREDFTVLAKDLVASLKTIVSTLVRCLKTVVFLVFIYVLGHHNLVKRTFFFKNSLVSLFNCTLGFTKCLVRLTTTHMRTARTNRHTDRQIF